jgi:hypothetical protein
MFSAAESALSSKYEAITDKKYAIPISSDVRLEVFSDTKPCNLKIESLQKGLMGYRFWNVDYCILSRGRENMKNCLYWAGLDYEADPEKQSVKYSIESLGGPRQI